MSKTLLVDADILLFKFACPAEQSFDFGEGGCCTTLRDFDEVVVDLGAFLWGLLRTTKTQKYILCLSDPHCFRYDILSSYKHNRQGKEKPKLYHEMRNHMLEKYPCKLKPRLEADDVMGVLATKSPGKYIVATIDKDLKQIPGWHYNWNKDAEPRCITEEEANLMFYQQCLSGDPTDGFSGCPGIGPRKAEKILEQCKGNYWQAILETYEKKGLDESYALTQARMARILRASDYDFEKQEVKEWKPDANQSDEP